MTSTSQALGMNFSLIMLINVQTLQPVRLHGGPALDGGGVEVIGVHPIGEHHAHLGHLHELVVRHAGRGRVAGDLGELRFHGGGIGVELVGRADDFREINGRDADAVAFENLLGVTHRVECTGPRADCTKANAAQAVHDSADAEELCRSRLKLSDVGCETCLLVSVNLMPACTRLLQTEIFPQKESRRRDGMSCFGSSG